MKQTSVLLKKNVDVRELGRGSGDLVGRELSFCESNVKKGADTVRLNYTP